ncbi:MAG: histidine kinase dimerization/phosphoacceptor domain -containing protein [Chitinophagaceae bacterium]
MKSISFTTAVVCFSLTSFSQVLPEGQVREKEQAVLNSKKPGIKQVGQLLELSSHYLFKDGEAETDLSRSLAYSRQAKDLSRTLNYQKGFSEASILWGTAAMEGGDLSSAAAVLQTTKADIRSRLSLIYSRYHRYGGANPVNNDSAMYYATEARETALAINNTFLEVEALKELYALHVLRHEYSRAESMLLRMTMIGNPKEVNMHETFGSLADIQVSRGNFDKALFYSIEALKQLDQAGDPHKMKGRYYLNLGNVYRNIGQFEKSVQYFDLAYNYFKTEKPDNWQRMWLRERSANALLKMGKNEQAMALIRRTQVEDPPTGNEQASFIHVALGNCYKALGDLAESEKHYLRAIELQQKAKVFDGGMYRTAGQFYVETGQYEKGRTFLEQALARGAASMGAAPKAHLYFLLFRIDSAAGKYLSAINYLMQNKALDDSIIQVSKVRLVEEYQVKYETEKKEQDLKLKEQSIQLLTSQSEIRQRDLNQVRLELLLKTQANDQEAALAKAEAEKKDKDILFKEQNIAHLKSEALLKQASLVSANKAKNLTLAGTTLSIIIILLLYNQFRINQRKNKLISQKNLSLEKLITEREWLLKEVHHRVKNNLQTIMSLLETHSSYLKDDALLAIQNSKHRVYAMSLIHQKLYRVEHSTSIDLAVYLPELIQYLGDSYDLNNRVRFKQHIESIQLDISQAIPVGLIFNEAISNSLKYAFRENQKGEINIETVRTPDKTIRVTISDNGIGLPPDWNKRTEDSLGMKLMKGLSEDIQASFNISTGNGTTIQMEFKVLSLRNNRLPE